LAGADTGDECRPSLQPGFGAIGGTPFATRMFVEHQYSFAETSPVSERRFGINE
jgi:hypothetical protein